MSHCNTQNSCCSSHNGCGCGCGSSQCGCSSTCRCGCQSGKGECDYPAKFLELADQAWMEVLKEKIKEKIKADGKQMDELAALISQANHARWHRKMEGKQCCSSYEEKLRNFFKQSCSTGKCS